GELSAPLYLSDFVVMRVATLFGVGGMSRTGTNFVETVLRKAAEGNEFPVVDDQTMSPTSAQDVAEFVLTVLRRGCDRGVYHVVNTGEVTRYGFAREILRQAGMPVGIVRPCTSEEFPTAARRPSYSALENQKLRSVVADGMQSWKDTLAVYLRAREEP
ncbi:MAG: sugar nucleotide-binding protein, partial [Rhodospirillaceae bacterium]|nr:sugar nucleotide-binding protein [Rhodospirillaceae bacterium]